jgi:hypothetical protein
VEIPPRNCSNYSPARYSCPFAPLKRTLDDLEAWRQHQETSYKTTRAAFAIAKDPVTNELEFSLYDDDGYGNGDHIFTVKYEDLKQAIIKVYADMEKEEVS